MTAFALKGLLTRKLRTALTAIAIVLGVATVSGTFVLTDSIDKAFDAIFSDVYREHRRDDHAEVGIRHRGRLRDDGGVVRPVPARQGPGAARRQGRDRRRREREHAARQGRQGDRVRRRAEPRLLRRPVEAAVQQPHPRRAAPGRARTRSSSTSRRPARRTSQVGDTIGVQVEGPVRAAPDLRARQVRRGQLDRRRDARRLRPRDRAEALRQGGQARPDPRGRQAGRLAREAHRADPARSCRRAPRCAPATRRRRRTPKSTDEFISFLRYFLLAFGLIALFVGAFVIVNSLSITIAQRTRELATLRTLGASRRQVRTLGRGRGARDGRDRLGDRPLPRPRRSPRGCSRSSTRSASRCRTTGSCSRRGRSSSRSRSGSSSR